MPDPNLTGGAAGAYIQTATGFALAASPFWVNFLYTVNIVAATIAAICGAIVGLAGVWRITRRPRSRT